MEQGFLHKQDLYQSLENFCICPPYNPSLAPSLILLNIMPVLDPPVILLWLHHPILHHDVD